MRKMISVLLAGVLAVNLGACSSAASKHLKRQNLLSGRNHGPESGGKRTLRIAASRGRSQSYF